MPDRLINNWSPLRIGVARPSVMGEAGVIEEGRVAIMDLDLMGIFGAVISTFDSFEDFEFNLVPVDALDFALGATEEGGGGNADVAFEELVKLFDRIIEEIADWILGGGVKPATAAAATILFKDFAV